MAKKGGTSLMNVPLHFAPSKCWKLFAVLWSWFLETKLIWVIFLKLLKSVWIENYQIKDENQKCFRKQYGRRKKKHKNMILLTICLLVIVMGAWWWCLNSKKKCGSFPTINNISTFAKGRKAAFSFWGHHGSSILMTHLPGNL